MTKRETLMAQGYEENQAASFNSFSTKMKAAKKSVKEERYKTSGKKVSRFQRLIAAASDAPDHGWDVIFCVKILIISKNLILRAVSQGTHLLRLTKEP